MDPSFSASLYYRHSGRFSFSGVLIAAGFGLLVGLPCAYVYAYLDHWNPFVYVNCLAAIGFGWAIGQVISSKLQSQKCRNVPIAGAAALLVVLVSYYLSWAVWLHTLTHIPVLALLQHPFDMWQVVLYVNEVGAWRVRGDVVKGMLLWVAWGSEAAGIIGFAVYTAVHSMQETTYCEGCDLFAKVFRSVCSVKAGVAPSLQNKAALKSYRSGLKAQAAELKQHLEIKDFAYVEQLGAVQPDSIAWYDFDLASCPQCNMTNTLSVTQHERIQRKKGKEKASERTVLHHLLLSANEADTIRKLKEKLNVPTSQAMPGITAVQASAATGVD